jgi:hypothetical protein
MLYGVGVVVKLAKQPKPSLHTLSIAGMTSEPALFPQLTSKSILDCQFSSWYPRFSRVSIKSTIIKPLPGDFFDYLQSDGVFTPKGSDPQYVFR